MAPAQKLGHKLCHAGGKEIEIHGASREFLLWRLPQKKPGKARFLNRINRDKKDKGGDFRLIKNIIKNVALVTHNNLCYAYAIQICLHPFLRLHPS